MIDIQSEVGSILHKFGNTELGRYKIQLYFDFLINPLEKEKDSYKEALQEIVAPIEFMRKRLKEDEQLNGMAAYENSISHNYLRSIAEKALS
jgi:hypothetical protein